ncbi:hypothetical protein [Marivita geojedonensis]|uniref:Uncharacterized protein n=1 Tax=Marivita geojedonensis TaxID=1123756 RepID=A0A1X4NLW7_9RHOB|nr:hypothetical protein [Marivita geojedonensis]OSQ51356.1 hypothetical protein MGEO_07710 [Marivita geojedonensis]PRY77991.1 hypothetical protein CLV76_107178 [Marivita geojedonensis]
MKCLTLTIAIYLGFFVGTANSQSSHLRGEMVCRVVSQNHLLQIDGKTYKQTGVIEEVKSGDTLIFEYSYAGGMFSSGLVDVNRGYIYKSLLFDRATLSQNKQFPKLPLITDTDLGVFGEDRISLGSLYGDSLEMRRYQKSDWHGLFSRIDFPINPLGSQLMHDLITLDCRHVVGTSSVNELYKVLLEREQ